MYAMKMLFYKLIILPLSRINKRIKAHKEYTDDVLIVFRDMHMGDFLVCAGPIERYRAMNPMKKFSILCAENSRQIIEETRLFDSTYYVKKGRKLKDLIRMLPILRIKAREVIVIPPCSVTRILLESLVSFIASDKKVMARDTEKKSSSKRWATFEKQYTSVIHVDEKQNYMVQLDEMFNRICEKKDSTLSVLVFRSC